MEWFQLPVLGAVCSLRFTFPPGSAQHQGSLLPALGWTALCTSARSRLRPGLTAPGVTGEVGKAKVAYCRAGVDLGLALPAPKRVSKPKPRCPSLGHACSSAAPASLDAPLTNAAGDAFKKQLSVLCPPVLAVPERRWVGPRDWFIAVALCCIAWFPRFCLPRAHTERTQGSRSPAGHLSLLPWLARPARRLDFLPGGRGKATRPVLYVPRAGWAWD